MALDKHPYHPQGQEGQLHAVEHVCHRLLPPMLLRRYKAAYSVMKAAAYHYLPVEDSPKEYKRRRGVRSQTSYPHQGLTNGTSSNF